MLLLDSRYRKRYGLYAGSDFPGILSILRGFLRRGVLVLVLALLHDLFPVCWIFGVRVA